MAFTEHTVYSFDEYVRCVTDIGRSRGFGPNLPNVLWARGHRKEEWNLLPTLIRNVEMGKIAGATGQFSKRAVEEELRKQHYIAKNYHFLPKEPKADLEWMEVMQHHGVKTRILDWSESLMHSLIFSLECFLNNKEYRTEDRIDCSPCVWILEPIDWNITALEDMLKNTKLVCSYLDELKEVAGISVGEENEIEERMKYMADHLKDYLSMDSAKHLCGIFNLSSIAGEFKEMRKEVLIRLLTKGEPYYCLFYFLVYMYMEKRYVKFDAVMPLSIVAAYHSERIRAQKGAFSIFPYYEEDAQLLSARKLNIYPDAMENMSRGNKYLHKILLGDPDKIAFEVMNTGMNVTWLYPEMPVVANTIEHRKIYV